MHLPLLQQTLAAIDFETTGLHPERGDRAIELAIIKRTPSGEIHHWSSLIKPNRKIPESARGIHGISNAMVEDAPTFSTLYPEIRSLLQNSIVIAHNAPFDISFLRKEAQLINESPPTFSGVVDTLPLMRARLALPKCNLVSIATRFNLIVHSAHRALHDAHNTLLIFLAFLELFPNSSDMTLQDITDMIAKYSSKGSHRKNIRKKIQGAIKEQTEIVLEYTSSDQNRPIFQERRILPKKFQDKHVLGFCYLREEERSFRLNRIHDIL